MFLQVFFYFSVKFIMPCSIGLQLKFTTFLFSGWRIISLLGSFHLTEQRKNSNMVSLGKCWWYKSKLPYLKGLPHSNLFIHLLFPNNWIKGIHVKLVLWLWYEHIPMYGYVQSYTKLVHKKKVNKNDHKYPNQEYKIHFGQPQKFNLSRRYQLPTSCYFSRLERAK